MQTSHIILRILYLTVTFVFIDPTEGRAFFWDSGVFPKEVVNTCKITWPEKSSKYVMAEVQVVVELKNTKGEVEEKAYIYLDCKGVPAQGDPIRALKTDDYRTECVGVRVTGLSKPRLYSYSVFSIRPEDIEVEAMSRGSKLVLRWQDSSLFEILDGKEFVWTMKSKLSGNSHKGKVLCGGW